MENDPEEMNDLAEHSEHKEKVTTMFVALLELQKQMNDSLDLNNTYQKTVGIQ